MTTLSKSVKVKNAACATNLLLFYNTKNRLHFSSQYYDVTVQFQKYLPVQGHLSTVTFSSCQSTTQREFNVGLRGRRRHEIQCQLRQSLEAGFAILPEL